MRKHLSLVIIVCIMCLSILGACGSTSAPVTNPTTTITTNPTPKPTTPALNSPFQIKADEDVTLSAENLKLKFAKVTEDSRCPGGVVCVWAGQVLVNLEVSKDAQKGTLSLGMFGSSGYGLDITPGVTPPVYIPPTNNMNTKVFGDYTVQLVRVDPYRGTTNPLKPSDYVITILVTANVGTLGSPVKIQYNEAKTFDSAGLNVKFTGMVYDGRCPRKIECFATNPVTVGITVTINSPSQFNLSTYGNGVAPSPGANLASIGDYTIKLMEVEPYPQTPNEKIPASAFSIIVIVTKGVATNPTTVATNAGALNVPTKIKVGEEKLYDNGRLAIRYKSTLKDERCPTTATATCSFSGAASVELGLNIGGKSINTINLSTFRTQALGTSPLPAPTSTDTSYLAEYIVQLLEVEPYPATYHDKNIKPSDYMITVLVSKKNP